MCNWCRRLRRRRGRNITLPLIRQGVNQFTQVWAVPPSSVSLRVRDVLVSQGTVVGPAPVTGRRSQISDVVGLANALALLPQEGVGFTLGRAAVINSSGQIDGAAGNLSDCVRVDGSSGPCGSGGAAGFCRCFRTARRRRDDQRDECCFHAGVCAVAGRQPGFVSERTADEAGVDYTMSGNAVTFLTASIPQTGDSLTASYRYGNPSNPLGSLTPAQVICSAVGVSTSSTTVTQLGSCTIPAGLLGTGDRVEVQFQYEHTGTSTGFTGQIKWAGTTVISRTTVAGETAMVGRLTFGIYSSGAGLGCAELGGDAEFCGGRRGR